MLGDLAVYQATERCYFLKTAETPVSRSPSAGGMCASTRARHFTSREQTSSSVCAALPRGRVTTRVSNLPSVFKFDVAALVLVAFSFTSTLTRAVLSPTFLNLFLLFYFVSQGVSSLKTVSHLTSPHVFFVSVQCLTPPALKSEV